jgi:hypothetical protein
MSSSRCRNCTCGPKEAGRLPLSSPPSRWEGDFHPLFTGGVGACTYRSRKDGVLGSGSRTFFNLDPEVAGQNLQIERLVFLGS